MTRGGLVGWVDGGNGWKGWCAVLALALAALGCGGGGGGGGDDAGTVAIEGDFFPLAVGDRWTYDDGAGGSMTARATGIGRVDGADGVVVQVTDGLGDTSVMTYVVGADGVRMVPETGGDPLPLAVGPVQVMRFPLAVGDSFVQIDRTVPLGIDFDSDGRNEDVAVRSVVLVVGVESIDTPTGRFAGAVHLRTTMTARVTLTLSRQTVVITMTTDDWFAPGVGPVRTVVRTDDPTGSETETWSVLAYRVGSRRSETVPPTVVAVRPAEGGAESAAAQVVVTFSEPMDAVSLAGAFTLVDAGGVPVPATMSVSGERATFVPVDPWSTGRYTAEVGAGAEDRAGNALAASRRWAFDIDITAPALARSTPADGATDVPLDARIELRFSEPIDPASLLPGNVRLLRNGDPGDEVPATVTLDGAVLAIAPAAPLERAQRYQVHVYDVLRDLVGNRLLSDVVFEFRADSGRFALPVALAAEGLVDAVAIGDVNGDGRADVLFTTGYTFNPAQDFKLMVLAQRADGSLAPAIVLDTQANYGCRASSIAVGDLDGDGRRDVLVGAGGCGIEVFRQGADSVLRSVAFIDSPQSRRIRLADLNGDGRPDLVGAGFYGTELSIWLQAVDGRFVLHASPAFEHAGDTDLDVGDVNGDGRPDVVVVTGSYPDTSIGIVLQQSDGSFGPVLTRAPPPATGVAAVAVGDVSGDGRADIVVTYGGNGGRLGVMLQQADGTLGAMTVLPSYDVPSQVEIADVNGDGRRDVVVGHSGWNAVGVYMQQADGTLAAEARYIANYGSNNPGSMAVGDVTGDGRPDIVFAEALLRQKVVPVDALGVVHRGQGIAATLDRLLRDAVR